MRARPRAGPASRSALVALLTWATLFVRLAGAQPAPPGSDLTVYLITVGPGDVVWQRFGHNAIWVEDRRTGRGVAYNWGVFDFDEPNFLGRFLTGEGRYRLELDDPREMVRRSAGVEDRSVWRQELALSPDQRQALLDFVTWNAREENKFYRYDYYRDNCSTRVRDALDRVLGGALRAATAGELTPRSYRSHTRRLTAGDLATYAGIQLALGRPADAPISAWDEQFLPVRLMQYARGVTVADGAGGVRPLVVREDTLYTARRAPEPAAPPSTVGYALAAGALLAGALALSGRAAARAAREGSRSAARFAFGALAGGWTLLAGVLGVALLLAGTVTRHVYMGRNLNLAAVNPLALIAFALVVAALASRGAGRARAATRASAAAALLAALSLLGAVLMALPGVGQRSWDVFAVALPVNLALWRALRARAAAVSGR